MRKPRLSLDPLGSDITLGVMVVGVLLTLLIAVTL